MKIIIDTHILLWFLNGEMQLKEKHKLLIADINNDIFISIASLWEIAIKMSLSKLTYKGGFSTLLRNIENQKIEILPIDVASLKNMLELRFHHGDPFDRMIIAQSNTMDIPLISYDSNFALYDVNLI